MSLFSASCLFFSFPILYYSLYYYFFSYKMSYSPSFPLLHRSISLSSLTATIFHCLVSLYPLLSMSPCSSVSGWKAPVLVIHSHNTSVSGFGKALKQAGGLSSEPRTKRDVHTQTLPQILLKTLLSHTQLSIATEQTYRLQMGLFI